MVMLIGCLFEAWYISGLKVYCLRAHYGKENVLMRDSFFPSLSDSSSVQSDYDILDDTKLWSTSTSSVSSVKFDQLIGEQTQPKQV